MTGAGDAGMPELQVALAAARAGGAIVSDAFRDGVEIRSKAAADLVTDADTSSERVIVDLIREAYPDHAVLAEESHRDDADSPHLWIVDPLDGTNNFAHRIPHFAVSIAYYRDGRPECGVVHNPVRDDWYVAVRGSGATCNGAPARVVASPRLDEVMVGVGFYYDRGAMMEATLAAIRDVFRQGVHGVRRFGTASLDLCQVGIGSFGAFFEYTLSPWDFAAGRLFVEEAGGRVTTCLGTPLPLARTTLLASNGLLHDAMLSVIGPHAPR
jgi:myo-inositol-1(or 4)-monophosphatase